MKVEETATVLEHVAFDGGYRRLIFDAPAIAAACVPGQFLHVRIPELSRESLRRPFSIYRSQGREVHVLYKPVGRGTQAMVDAQPGERFSLLGPLGNGFPLPQEGALPVFVAGGYGVAPLSFLARRLDRPGIVFIGARSAPDILCVADFESLGWDVRVSTEDGSAGSRGRVTEALDRWASEAANVAADARRELYECGPEGLARAICARSAQLGWQAWISLDRPMGCGVGACLACVQRVHGEDGRPTWARCCTEGPVFDARTLIWEGA